MLRADTFWTYEGDAPLLNLNKGYLQAQGDTLFTRVGTWLPIAGVAPGNGVEIAEEETDPERKRIIVADAERTFRHDSNRATFVRLLTHLNNKFGDYAQGLSYVASFLSIYLHQSDVVALTSEFNFNPKYLPGYWKHEAIKFATDAYVFQELAIKHLPTIAEHLQKNGVDPSSYCQKWFVGLCVHVLPYEHLFKYFEGFLAGGHKFLMQFGLSLLNQLQDKLLAIQLNFSAFLGLLRLDPKFIPHDDKFDEMMKRVFDGVKDFNLDDVNFAEMRVHAYDKYLAKRIESAKKQAEEEIDVIEDCQICLDDFPEVYCKECNLKICESCHNKPPADSKHSRSHKVKEIVEDEDEEEEEDDEDDEEKKDDSVDKATAGLEKLNVK